MSDPVPNPAADSGAWAPLRRPVFRSLWIAALVSNIGTWMQSMGAAWLMTELTQSPARVALVQAAQSLPLFLLALPAGALADIIDRRRQLIAAQTWMLVFAGLLTATTFAGLTTPGWLLLATFLIGCGAAATVPAFSASIQELVPRPELQAAVALNGLSINVSRAVGPALAGLIVVWSGTAMVFLLNTLSFLGVILALRAWKRLPTPGDMPAERLLGALRTGYRYARHAPLLQRVLLRALAFFPFASAVWALLPLVASRELGGDARLYGALLGCIGVGAVTAALLLPAFHPAAFQGPTGGARLPPLRGGRGIHLGTPQCLGRGARHAGGRRLLDGGSILDAGGGADGTPALGAGPRTRPVLGGAHGLHGGGVSRVGAGGGVDWDP